MSINGRFPRRSRFIRKKTLTKISHIQLKQEISPKKWIITCMNLPLWPSIDCSQQTTRVWFSVNNVPKGQRSLFSVRNISKVPEQHNDQLGAPNLLGFPIDDKMPLSFRARLFHVSLAGDYVFPQCALPLSVWINNLRVVASSVRQVFTRC